jgi:hypothetical protein
MDKTFLKERKIAVKEIASKKAQLDVLFAEMTELADRYGIRVEVDLPVRTGYNGDAWYMPKPPVQMQEGTEDRENFDPSGTDWSWEASTKEHMYDAYDEPFGWKNSSSQCS